MEQAKITERLIKTEFLNSQSDMSISIKDKLKNNKGSYFGKNLKLLVFSRKNTKKTWNKSLYFPINLSKLNLQH